MGYITAHRMGDLHMCDGTTHVGTDVDIRIESWLNPWLFRLRKCQASMCMCNNSNFVDRVSLLDFPACFPDLAIANHEEDNKTMMTMDCCKHASVPTFLECVRAIKIKIHLNWSVKTLEIFSLNFCQRLKSISAKIFFSFYCIYNKSQLFWKWDCTTDVFQRRNRVKWLHH